MISPVSGNDHAAPWPGARVLGDDWFERDAQQVACALLGKIIRHRVQGLWLSAQIIETEAYYRDEKGSHASLGFTDTRRALFLAPGTIYMYYARGGDSLNFSVHGAGNAVLVKSALTLVDAHSGLDALALMQRLNPDARQQPRPRTRLCAGQTLLCRSLGIRVPEWNARRLDPQRLWLEDTGVRPARIIQTRRLGIPQGRDDHLPYRFVDAEHARHCTRNPLRRSQIKGRDWWMLALYEGNTGVMETALLARHHSTCA